MPLKQLQYWIEMEKKKNKPNQPNKNKQANKSKYQESI